LVDRRDSNQQAAESAVSRVIASDGARLQAARFAAMQASGSLDDNLQRADSVAQQSAPITVRSQTVDAARTSLPEGFSYSAPTMLVLFVFINALAAGSGIIQSRQLGMYQRMTAAP